MKNYKKVYFRTDSPLYRTNAGIGFENQDSRNSFYSEVMKTFLNNGWQVKDEKYKISSSYPTVIKEKQELYLHPDHFSGVVIEENITEIEQLVKNIDGLKYRWTDIYEDVFDITDEEYMNMLKSKRKYIEQDILEAFKTKRRNLYVTSSRDCINRVLNKYRIKRLTCHIGVISSNNLDVQYFSEIFEELVNKGEIVTANTKNGTGYRTRTDKEKKSA